MTLTWLLHGSEVIDNGTKPQISIDTQTHQPMFCSYFNLCVTLFSGTHLWLKCLNGKCWSKTWYKMLAILYVFISWRWFDRNLPQVKHMSYHFVLCTFPTWNIQLYLQWFFGLQSQSIMFDFLHTVLLFLTEYLLHRNVFQAWNMHWMQWFWLGHIILKYILANPVD